MGDCGARLADPWTKATRARWRLRLLLWSPLPSPEGSAASPWCSRPSGTSRPGPSSSVSAVTIERRALVSQHQVGVDDLSPRRLQSYTVTVAYRFGQGARRDDEFRNKGRFGGTMRSVTRMTHEARRALSLGLVIAVVAGLAALLGPASPAAASGHCTSWSCESRRGVRPLSDGASYLTAAQAEQDAIDGGALDPGAQPSSAAQFTTYSTAAVAMGESSQANPYVDPSTPVWLVTVHATPSVLPSPPTGGAIAAPTVYSEILDAINGNVIDFCGGCDSVTAS